MRAVPKRPEDNYELSSVNTDTSQESPDQYFHLIFHNNIIFIIDKAY